MARSELENGTFGLVAYFRAIDLEFFPTKLKSI